jgi:hypothetical protein
MVTAFTLERNPADYLSGYTQRQRDQKMQAKQRKKIQEMLENLDFRDRLYLFMTDLGGLSPGDGLDSLPHNDGYFDTSEKRQLSSYTRLLDQTAMPEEILLSFEQTFGSTGTKINGVWKSHNPRLVEWLRDGKQYIDGTIRGVQAELIHTVQLYCKAKEEEERKEEIIKTAKIKLAVKRRKETIERKKLESATPEVEAVKTDFDESSVTPTNVIKEIPVQKVKRARRIRC